MTSLFSNPTDMTPDEFRALLQNDPANAFEILLHRPDFGDVMVDFQPTYFGSGFEVSQLEF